ncbi:hypothetical protein [Lacunimicrobium album]
MISRPNTDLKAFYEFVGSKFEREPGLTPREVIAEWLDEEDWIESLKQSFEDLEAGRTISAEEVSRRLREGL